MATTRASPRRLLLAALAVLLLFPLLGWWLGEVRTFSGIGIVLASVWLIMAGVGILRHRRHTDV